MPTPSTPTIDSFSIAGSTITLNITAGDPTDLVKVWMLHGGIGSTTELAGSRTGSGSLDVDLSAEEVFYLGFTFYEPVQFVAQSFDPSGIASDLSNLILPTLSLGDTGVEVNDLTREPDPTKLKFNLVNPNGHQVIFSYTMAGTYHFEVFTGDGAKEIDNLWPITATFVVIVITTAHQFVILGIHESPAYQVFDYQRPHVVGGA